MSSSIKCDFCSKNLKNKYTLIRHIENLHPNIEEKKLFQTIEKIKGTKTFSERCSGCGQNFISSSHLKKHQENCDRFSMIDLKNKIESLENIEDLQLIRKIIDCKYQNIKGIGTGSLNTTINAEGVTSHNINNAIGSSFNMGNTNSNNTNNIINNITVMNLGHENTDPIEEREFFFGILNQEVDLSEVAHAILKVTEAQTVMITRSEAGLSLFNRQGERKDFPVQVREVKDVTGAGDTVLAMLTYAIANEISYEESAEFCNIAAGIVIEQLGCARVNLADISHRLLEKQMHCKLFDEKQLFALEKVLTHCPYTILVLEELSSITPTLFEALSKLSTPDSSLLLYLKDGSPCSTSLKMLTSLMEVNFILIHSAKVEKVCHQLTPKAVYSFYSGQLEQHSSLKRSLFQKNKN